MRRTNFRRTSTFRGSRSRPNYQWARLTQQNIANINITTSGVPFDLVEEFRDDAGLNMGVLGATVSRIHFSGAFESATVPGSILSQCLAMGVIKTSGLSGAEVPRPLDDQHADWLWWSTYYCDATVGSRLELSGPDRAIDMKSKRRLDELEDTVWLVLQTVGGTLNGSFTTSTLLRMHR